MASEQIQGRKIAITGHGFDVTETDIRSIFDRFGEISEVVYIRNKDTGKSKGFSFVVYKDHTSAQRAINSMHHDFIFDRRVSVEFARQHKLDELSPSNYSPGLAKPPPFHHPHGLNTESFRHVRRPQQNDFFHPRPPMESRYPFPPNYPPQVRSEMNPSPPNRFHTPAIRSETVSKEKTLEVIQEPETAQHPLATPSSLSGASEQEDGEIPSGPDKKSHEPLEDGEMLDSGTPNQKVSDSTDELPFSRQRTQTPKPSQFSISNWKIDANTEKLLANIIRIQGSVKIDSNEAQRVWAQGGLRKDSVSSPPTEFEGRLHKSASDQLSPTRAEQDKHEHEIPSPNISSSSRTTNWNHARSGDQPNTNDVRWEEKRPLGSTLQDAHLSKPIPMEAQHMIGHHAHEGREWAPPGLSRHRPDLRHILGSDNHIADQNPGNYGYNTYHYQRSIQDQPSRPTYSHPPPSHHGHFPLRHPGPDSQFQSFPQQQQQQQQQVMPMRGHHSQQGYMPGPGHHPSPDLHQSAPPMMDQPYEIMHQHPPSDNYPYAPIHMQDHGSGSMPGYSVPFPGGNNSMSIEQNVGLHDHSVPQSLAPQHQQPMDVPGQLLGNDNNTNYQISPATIAQATIAQAAVNSDQCQDLSRSKDPMTLMSRMYVGNLDPKQVTKEDLHDTFSVYGRILDIKIHNHFAFIQFDNPFSCMDAIHTAHANTIQGQQPKLQLAADGQRARNEMISNGNTSSLPPDPKELPPNMPYPNPFRGQSGHLPTFLTVQPAQQPPIEPSIAAPPNFQSSTPIQMPTGISQPIIPQQAILHPQNPLSGPGLGPQPIQTPGNLLQPSQEAANAQINAQLLSTALGLDPSALATILSSLPMLAKAKDESSDVKAPQNPKLFSNSLDSGKVGSSKKDRSDKESKKRKKKEGEKHAKAKRLNELEAKKQKAKKKEEELAKVRARLARDVTGNKDAKPKERLKHKMESKQDSKLSKHFHSDEVSKKSIKHESSTAKGHSKHRAESKPLAEPTTSREKEGKVHIAKDKNLGEKTEKPCSDKSIHKSRHESKTHNKSHSNDNSHKRSHYSDSPTKQDDIMDQYAYLYDMMTRNPMNKLIKDYHDYYVGIYGYDFSHWSSEYERFLEDYPMEEDTKEMLELMQCFRGYPYYYGSMCGGNSGELETEHSSEKPCSPSSIQDQTKRMKISDDAKHQDASQAPK